MMKICTLAPAYDVKVICHGSLPQINAQVSFCQNAALVPMMENLLVIPKAFQYFFKYPMQPQNGFFIPLEVPGVGIDLDESKIESEQDVSWC